MEEHKSYITDSTGRETELSQHGIYFARGGAIELLTFQSMEQVLANDWQEEDGLEIHTKSIVRTCPYINLRFIIVVALESSLRKGWLSFVSSWIVIF